MGARRVTDFTPITRGGGPGLPPGSSQTRPLTARGMVAIAPPNESSAMEVVVRTVTVTYPTIIPAGNWSPRGTALPQVGDECLVVYDDIGDAFVPVWAGVTILPTATRARAYRTAALTLTAGAWTAFPLDTKSYDTANAFNASTGVYTVPKAGAYLCAGSIISGTDSAGGAVIAGLKYNSALPVTRGSAGSFNTALGGEDANVCDVIQASAGDTIQLAYYSVNAIGIFPGSAGSYLTVLYQGQ